MIVETTSVVSVEVTESPCCSAPPPPPTELQTVRMQLRIVTALFLSQVMFSLADPAVYILSVPTSFYFKVSTAIGNPPLLASCFIAAALALLPYLIVQFVHPPPWVRHVCAKLACFGLFGAGALWIFVADFIKAWDVPTIAGVFTRLGIGCVLASVCLAVVINAHHARLRGIAKKLGGLK